MGCHGVFGEEAQVWESSRQGPSRRRVDDHQERVHAQPLYTVIVLVFTILIYTRVIVLVYSHRYEGVLGVSYIQRKRKREMEYTYKTTRCESFISARKAKCLYIQV